jgi:antitoxin component YwqK of YwqJK toxin-antitoxin module
MCKNNCLYSISIVIFGLLCISQISLSQEFINTRKITLTRNDTTVVAGILADLKLESVQKDAFYYWYSNAGVFSNQGGFSGNLLHGEYIEYEQNGSLILKGYFDRGLKNGTWVYWYPSGQKKKEMVYKDGSLNGKLFVYSDNGKIRYKAEYKNDRLDGTESLLKNDTLYNITYRNGTQLRKKIVNVKKNSR